jgi:hypothetical protein
MNARKFSIVLLEVMLALALVGVVSAKGATALANQITLHDQEIHQGILMVDAVTAAQDGWIVIYDRPNLHEDGIVGYAPLKQGLNPNVRVTLDTNRIKRLATLWARLHVDNKPVGVFEWGLDNRPFNDLPVMQDGQQVIVPFGLSGDSAPMLLPPAIAIKSQDVKHTNPIIADSVTTPVDGWLVIYQDKPFDSGMVVGYAPVYQGINTGVQVAIDAKRIGDKPTLWAVLHTDQGTHGLFEWGTQFAAKADTPLYYQGQPVMTTFGTTAP